MFRGIAWKMSSSRIFLDANYIIFNYNSIRRGGLQAAEGTYAQLRSEAVRRIACFDNE
jgi:hypothetical protein